MATMDQQQDGIFSLPVALGYADFVPTEGRVPFPDFCCDLTWTRDEAYITGPESKPTAASFPGYRVRLLRLDPFITRAWLGIPLGAIANQQVMLSDINRGLATTIRALGELDELINLQRPEVAGSRQSADVRLVMATKFLLKMRSVHKAAFAVDLSERQLERLFASELGVLPQKMLQIVRFRIAAQAARRGETLADAAALASYADQSHFTRECQAFTGKTPRALIAAHVGIVQDAELGHF
jgi:AraC-like DNA-binding protein